VSGRRGAAGAAPCAPITPVPERDTEMSTELDGVVWFKSSRSGAGKECVEVAFLSSGRVGVRDSKNPDGPALIFGPGDWTAFTASLPGAGSDAR
jgi:uncharacterized protein DUF397